MKTYKLFCKVTNEDVLEICSEVLHQFAKWCHSGPALSTFLVPSEFFKCSNMLGLSLIPLEKPCGIPAEKSMRKSCTMLPLTQTVKES